MTDVSITATAEDGGKYHVIVDGHGYTTHVQEREAMESATNAKLQNPDSEVYYEHRYRVMIGASVAAAAGGTGARPQPPEEGQALGGGTISASVESATSYSATGSVATGGTGSYSYQWHEDTTNDFTPGVGTEISGATSQNLAAQTGKTEGVTYYLKRVVDDGSTTATSNQTSATPSSVVPFFSDDFETGDLTSTGGGFAWGSGSANTSVGDMNATAGVAAHSGTYALKFTYTGKASGQDSTAERRFSITPGKSELWVEYWLYVPSNFVHRSDAPNNNKFFRVWQTDASAGDFSVTTEYDRVSDSTSKHRMIAEQTGGTTTETNPNPFIGPSGPITPGTWAQIRFWFNAASGLGQSDGNYRLWVDGVLVSQLDNFEFWNQGGLGSTLIEAGYFFGWANSGFTDDTTFWVDDAAFYDSNPGW